MSSSSLSHLRLSGVSGHQKLETSERVHPLRINEQGDKSSVAGIAYASEMSQRRD